MALNASDKLVVSIGIVTILMFVTALANAYKAFGLLAVANMALYITLAASAKNIKYAAIAGVTVFIVQATFLLLVFYYWELYRGVFPGFTILGMHPGFFIMFPVWWITGFAVMTLLYLLLFEKAIISEEDVRKFREKVKGTS
ncbi:MAG: hypothetical protein QXF06_00160 [Archaeoglobaceae archaeon]